MPPTPVTAADSADQQTSAEPACFTVAQVRDILDRHGLDADPAEIFTRAVELARHDAVSAQDQAGRTGIVTDRLLGQLRAILTVAGPVVLFLLQPELRTIPPWSARALALFAAVCVVTYGYTFWTSRPRLPRDPTPTSSGWLALVGLSEEEREQPGRIPEHYVLLAVDLLTTYGRETADNGDVAHYKYRRNQKSGIGITAAVGLGVVCALLLLLRW